MTKAFLTTIAVLLAGLPAGAGAARLDLKIERVQVGLGEPFPLTLSVTAGPAEQVTRIRIEGVDQFTVQSGPEVSMSFQVDMARGTSNQVRTYRYVLVPQRLGTFVLGPATAVSANQSLRSNTVALKVVARTQLRARDEKMFLEARADKTRAWLGEQVTVSYYLYSRVSYYGLELRKAPQTEGFWAEELEVPSRGFGVFRQTYIDGVPYRVRLIKRQALFPLKPGRLTVGPMVLVAQVGMSFFGGGRKLTRASQPLVVQVMQLPAKGRPADFPLNNVGSFRLNGGVDRKRVAMGEAIKYRLRLEGEGNIKNVVLPELPQGDGYRRFDPTPKLETHQKSGKIGGARTMEYLLSPTRPGQLVVPELVFHYFDPGAAAYRTLRIPQQIVAVGGGPRGAAASPTASPPVLPGADPDLRGIHDGGEVAGGGTPLHRAAFFWILLVAPLFLYGLVLAGGRLSELRARLRLRAEPRRRVARAWRRLREAERMLEEGEAGAFFGEIARVLVSFVEAKLDRPLGSLTSPELRRALVERGFPEELVGELLAELESCDFGRFAPRGSRQEEMRTCLSRARSLLDRLDRVRVARPPGEAPEEPA